MIVPEIPVYGVGISQLPAVRERAIGGSRGLIRIAAMPERPGQHDKGADPDVAMLVEPMQRPGGFAAFHYFPP